MKLITTCGSSPSSNSGGASGSFPSTWINVLVSWQTNYTRFSAVARRPGITGESRRPENSCVTRRTPWTCKCKIIVTSKGFYTIGL